MYDHYTAYDGYSLGYDVTPQTPAFGAWSWERFRGGLKWFAAVSLLIPLAFGAFVVSLFPMD